MKVKLLSHVQILATPWTIAHQAPLSMGFSRQEYWSRLPWPSPRDLSDPGIKPGSPALQADALPSEPSRKPPLHVKYGGKEHLCGIRETWVQSLTLLWKSCYSSLHSPINWTQYVTHILFEKQCICGSDTQSCPTLCDLMDYSPPGSSVREILQARMLEWVAIPFSRGSSHPRDQTCVP